MLPMVLAVYCKLLSFLTFKPDYAYFGPHFMNWVAPNPSIPTPAPKPIPITPKKSAAIRIVNPNTKQEVNLKEVALTELTSTNTSSVRSFAVKILVPGTKEALNLDEIKKAEALPSEPKSDDTIVPSKEEIQVEAEAKAEVKTLIVSVKEKVKEDLLSPVSAVSEDVSSPMERQGSQESFTTESMEEGEIAEIQRTPARMLTAADTVTYPSSVKDIPNFSSGTFKYTMDFLKAFAALDIIKPEALSVEDMKTDDSKYQKSDRRHSERRLDRKSSDYKHDRFGDSKGRASSSRRSNPPSLSRQGSGSSDSRGYKHVGNLPPRPGHRGTYSNEPQEVLVRSENAWNPQAKSTDDPLEVVSRKVKGLLNKLTVEFFDSISNQILNVGIVNKDILAAVISIIFEKQSTSLTLEACILNYAPSCRLLYQVCRPGLEGIREVTNSVELFFPNAVT